jgi:ABC-type glutathione transport system ATPase component
MAEPALVELEDLSKLFDVSPPLLNRLLQGEPRVLLTAVDGLSLKIPRGKTFSLVGESGCGKSTVARLVVGLRWRIALRSPATRNSWSATSRPRPWTSRSRRRSLTS